jgi:hypothetical protein
MKHLKVIINERQEIIMTNRTKEVVKEDLENMVKMYTNSLNHVLSLPESDLKSDLLFTVTVAGESLQEILIKFGLDPDLIDTDI